MNRPNKWAWLPDHMRAAAKRAGLFSSDDLRIGAAADSAWATDGNFLLHIGDPATAERAKALLPTQPNINRELPAYQVLGILRFFDRETYQQTVWARSPGEVGLWTPEPERTVILGEVAVSRPMYTMVSEIWPGVQWFTRGRLDVMFAVVGTTIVAALMPQRLACAA